ncbi:MAG: HmuY family protein [Polyangiaceae bacterium]
MTARTETLRWIGAFMACAALGCEEIPQGSAADPGVGGGGAGAGASGGDGGALDPFGAAAAVDIEVPQAGRARVDLDSASVTEDSGSWDLAFEGQDVLTNGGVSGDGEGAAFGPFEREAFLGDEVPEHPFLIEDKPGGAFLDWYAYDSASHVLYSRYHVQGVKRGDSLFKVQILGYYGEVEGAPAGALYSVRFAQVSKTGPAETVTLSAVDATAGGVSGGDSDPSACLVLATANVLALTPAQAAQSKEWDLCFRRAGVSVNGGTGGPAGVLAVDLDRAATAGETLGEVEKRTADSELARFESVTFAALSDEALPWRGDRVVSAFSDAWTVPGSSPLAPAPFTWLVAGADGVTPFFVAFESFSGATDDHPGTVRLRVKHIGGAP